MSLLTTLSWALPHRLLSSIARSAAYSENPWLKQRFIEFQPSTQGKYSRFLEKIEGVTDWAE